MLHLFSSVEKMVQRMWLNIKCIYHFGIKCANHVILSQIVAIRTSFCSKYFWNKSEYCIFLLFPPFITIAVFFFSPPSSFFFFFFFFFTVALRVVLATESSAFLVSLFVRPKNCRYGGVIRESFWSDRYREIFQLPSCTLSPSWINSS